MAEIAVTVQASGEAYVALVVGAAPEVRESVALDVLEATDAIPALDGLVLDFDHYGRVVGLRITGAVDSILAPSLLEAAVPSSEMERERAGKRIRACRRSASMLADGDPATPSRCPTSQYPMSPMRWSGSRRSAGPWFTRGRHGRSVRTLREVRSGWRARVSEGRSRLLGGPPR